MSRLIVKNLPKNATEQSVKQLFSQKGTITDIQLKYTSDGKFRKFGFVGYQKESEAEEAIKSFHNTYINTSKITVETCSTLGDKNKPRSWSKYAPDSKEFKKNNKTTIKEDIPEQKKVKPKKEKKVDATEQLLEKYKDDPLFEEYLQVSHPKEIEKFQKLKQIRKDECENETENNLNEENEVSNSENDCSADKIANKQISDLEYMKKLIAGGTEKKPREKMKKKIKEKIKLFTVKLRDLPYNIKKRDIKQFFKPVSCYSIRVPRNIHGIAFVGFKTEKELNKALVKNRSFISGKQVSVAKYTTSEEKSQSDNTLRNISKNKWQTQEEAIKNEENIGESGRIFIRNLAYTTTEEDIEKLFSEFGPLTEVNLPVDASTKQMKGFGTVTYLLPEHAVKAYSQLDGYILHGRMLHLLPGKNKDTNDEDLEDTNNYKKKKSAKLKAQAGSSHNWNSLFLGHDAVAEVIADSFGTTKEDVIGPDGKGSAAVRLALGETQIVAQTRKYLEQQGVILDAFNNAVVKRSKTLILLKNLPSKTEVKEIREIFEKHGDVGRVILPPSGITAIVEFLEPSEAKKAFSKLAYTKFKNMPLYLEWAPDNSLTDPKTNQKVESTNGAGVQELTKEKEIEGDIREVEEEEEEPEPDTTLFVKNLNFKTTDEQLKQHFVACGKIHYANVASKKDPKDPNKTLSMGYGFIRFVHKASADKALKTLQQSVLDGKSLELKRSERTFKNEVQTTRKVNKATKQTGSKILVRNVPFQAKKKEIEELFSTFGEIRALRLPKKMAAGSDSHRGFAFIDYTTSSDAKAAFEALSQSTHLYGRRLVLEWAATEEGVDEIRKRTASHFNPEVETKKSKKSVFNME
ncbi:probable RNA-binding protein 19 [Diorhabda sublineata]|uniref:probable RNA-binding protein 19 n=1 Tax=Diorhabda sublineata TaxID=1163346 RepID=UPI0024E06575|nr:probable RNA-binding protein 19 [Diorhabda sublineata]